MQKKFDYFCVGVVYLLGTIHTVGTIFFQRPVDLDFLMYVGTGLAFLIAGSVNIPAVKYSSAIVLMLALITNIVFTGFMIFITIVITDIRAISVIGAFFCLLVSTILDLKKPG